MSRLFFYKDCRILFFLFFVSTVSAGAQERNRYDGILKESLKKDFMKMNIPLEIDSNFYKSQILKDRSLYKTQVLRDSNLIKTLLLRGIDIIPPKDFSPLKEQPKISPYVTMGSYKNSKPIDKGKFNGDGSFSGVFALQSDVVMSRATRVMVNVPGLLMLLATKTGIISTGIFHSKKESKKSKTLKTIKNLYHIDD